MTKKNEISREVQVFFSGACDWEGGRHPGKMQKAHISCGAAGASSENYDESFNCTDTCAVSDDEV